MLSSIAKLISGLPHDLRLGTLGNKEILGEPQIWVET